MSSISSMPSLGAVVTQALATLKRFPVVLAIAVACAATAIVLVDGPLDPDPWIRLLAAATLGLPLLTALAITAERRPGVAAQAFAAAVGVAILAGYYAAWPGWTESQRAFRWVQLGLAFHLSVAVLPFVGRPLHRAFWQYNRRLMERFVIAAIFSAVIFIGLALALLAVNKLLGVDIEGAAYPRIWMLVAFVVNTWIFLAAVPRDVAGLEDDRDYPRLLKLMAQRILVPLVSLYIVILLLYLFRVIATREWPSGWTGWLVSALGVTGTFALLLVQPIARDDSEGWIARFSRVYWIAVLPAVVMLWLALRQRIGQYGFTEARYAVLALSIWLFAVGAFYTIRRSHDMRIVPATLGLVALVTFAGPWSVYSVSFRSQYHRLESMFAASGMLTDGKLHPPTRVVPERDRREIPAVIRYLLDRQGRGPVTQWFAAAGTPVDSVLRHGPPYAAAERIASFIGVPRESRELAKRTFTAVDQGPLEVAGYDVLIRRIELRRAGGDTGYLALFDPDARTVRAQHGPNVLVAFPLDSAIGQAMADTTSKYRPPIIVAREGAGWDGVLRITGLSNRDSTGVFRAMSGSVLLKRHR